MVGKENENEAEALNKFIQYMKTHKTIPDSSFTVEQMKALKNVANREIGRIYLREMAESWKSFLMLVGFFATAYIAFKSGLEDWLKELLK